MEAVMKRLPLLAILVVLSSRPGSAQTTDELVNDGRNPANVTTQSMGYHRQSYSSLKDINKSNVQRLVPV
jgi:glucose dehydrogenase